MEFLNLDYRNYVNELDVHHEGTSLSAQLNFFTKQGLWTGTFYDYGFLGNNIGIFSNFFFDDYSIGIQRFTFKFLILINKIFLILICYQITWSINLKSNKNFFFILLSLSSLTLANFHENVTAFHPRTFLFLIFTFVVFKAVAVNKKNSILYFIIGSFSLISILFYYDIGTYVNALIIIIMIYFLLSKMYFKVIKNYSWYNSIMDYFFYPY